MARFTFEDIFREFVLAFGGEPGPERQGVRSADYVFRTYNVIAELKCLEVDQTDAMRSKFSELATRYGIETTLPRVIPGRDFMRDFQRVLRGPIENIVKDANQQIRGTKEFLSLPDTHGIMLIFNAGNPLHALAPQHYAELVGEVIQKSNDQVRRFPHIDGLIYFSFDVTTFDEQTQKHMPFWHPAQVRGDSVDGVKRFQQDLKVAWCSYVEQMTGAKVVSHHRETGWPK